MYNACLPSNASLDLHGEATKNQKYLYKPIIHFYAQFSNYLTNMSAMKPKSLNSLIDYVFRIELECAFMIFIKT
jgi:hypothetical protein